jgi:hypothetical protein
MRALLLPVLLAGCAAPVTIHDFERSFRADLAELRPAPATSADFRPLRMENAAPMQRTIETGERYLDYYSKVNLDRDYVRAMLACSYLTRGRVADARRLVRHLAVPGPNAPDRERGAIERTRWLTGACHALEGRLELDAMLERGEGVVEFIESYGTMVGYAMPRPHEKDYLSHLERYTLDMQSVLFAPEPRSPRQLDARTQRIIELRRILAEFAYNDSAALKSAIPRPESAAADDWTNEFFSIALSSLYVTLSYLSDDLVPRVRMEEAQKQWLREQALSTYEAARELARYYLPDDRLRALETGLVPKARATPAECRERLYARLYVAQKEVLAWITIRGE